MVIQNSKLPFRSQHLHNVYFVQSLAVDDRVKVTEPVKSFTGKEQKAKNQRGLPDTRQGQFHEGSCWKSVLTLPVCGLPSKKHEEKTTKRQLQEQEAVSAATSLTNPTSSHPAHRRNSKSLTMISLLTH